MLRRMWKGFKEDVDTPKVVRLQNKELFVLKTILISESCEKVIEVHDFIKGIEDEDYKKTNYISFPKFKLAGVDFSINMWPDNIANDGPGFISVFLRNHGGEDQTISMTVRLDSGVEGSWKMRKVSAGKSCGLYNFLSHQEYRKWAEDHGDVLRLRVVVTLHSEAEGDGWTR